MKRPLPVLKRRWEKAESELSAAEIEHTRHLASLGRSAANKDALKIRLVFRPKAY